MALSAVIATPDFAGQAAQKNSRPTEERPLFYRLSGLWVKETAPRYDVLPAISNNSASARP
jgi:hypothetical protein